MDDMSYKDSAEYAVKFALGNGEPKLLKALQVILDTNKSYVEAVNERIKKLELSNSVLVGMTSDAEKAFKQYDERIDKAEARAQRAEKQLEILENSIGEDFMNRLERALSSTTEPELTPADRDRNLDVLEAAEARASAAEANLELINADYLASVEEASKHEQRAQAAEAALNKALEYAWQSEVIETLLEDSIVGEGNEYADKADWIDCKRREWTEGGE